MKNRILRKYSFCFLVAIIAISLLFCASNSGAWFSDKETTNTATMAMPSIVLGAVSNESETERVEIDALAIPEITATLTSNVRIVLRARVMVKWFDDEAQEVISGDIPTLMLSATNWTTANGGLEYYYNSIIPASATEQTIGMPISAVLNNVGDVTTYEGYTFSISVSFEYHQADYVNYDNHLWKSTAPASWINAIKGGAL